MLKNLIDYIYYSYKLHKTKRGFQIQRYYVLKAEAKRALIRGR